MPDTYRGPSEYYYQLPYLLGAIYNVGRPRMAPKRVVVVGRSWELTFIKAEYLKERSSQLELALLFDLTSWSDWSARRGWKRTWTSSSFDTFLQLFKWRWHNRKHRKLSPLSNKLCKFLISLCKSLILSDLLGLILSLSGLLTFTFLCYGVAIAAIILMFSFYTTVMNIFKRIFSKEVCSLLLKYSINSLNAGL